MSAFDPKRHWTLLCSDGSRLDGRFTCAVAVAIGVIGTNYHIVEGTGHVARQREIVVKLTNDGRDLKSAQAFLMQFQTMLAHRIADRDRIRAELSAMR